MIKKPSNTYVSPVLEVLQFDVSDIVTTSGDNFVEWDWSKENPFDVGLFN